MPKRKRDTDLDNNFTSIQDQALRVRVSRLKARFDNGVQQLTAQLRLARGFDRQKMTRRNKQAGGDKIKLQRLEAEVQVLKDLNEAKIAKNYLLKQCVRTKRIHETEAFRMLFGDDAEKRLKGSNSVAESNVLGRLFKSNPVNEVLPEIMKGIREVIGLNKPPEQPNGMNGSNKQSTEDMEGIDASTEEFEGFSDGANASRQSYAISKLREPDSANIISAEEDSDQLDDNEIEAYNSRLAASSEDDSNLSADENESSSIEHNDTPLDDMEITTDDENYSDIEEPNKPQSHTSHNTKPNSTAPKTSTKKPPTFLPTLLHTGYFSGSDSDSNPNDLNSAHTFAADVKPRKNRRGQKERQAIAEKKYGSRAKHLLKARGAEGVHGDRQRLINANESGGARGPSRSEGWDARRGAVEASSRGRGRGGGGRGRGRNFGGRENGTGFGSVRQREDTRPEPGNRGKDDGNAQQQKLHPSWEAARKRKMETAGVGANAFSGKKITFD